METAEKRYFKRFAGQQKSDSDYLVLFHLIDQQEAFDLNALRESFPANKLRTMQHYLRNLILKCLRNFHSKHSAESQLLDLLRNIELLYARGLVNICRDEILKAERLARKFESNVYLIRILAWKRRLVLSLERPTHAQEELQEITQNVQEKLDDLGQMNTYWAHTLRIFQLYGKPEWNDLLQSPELNESAKLPSLQAKTMYHHIRSSHHLMSGNTQAARKEVLTSIAAMEACPDRISNDPGPYLTLLSNFFSYSLGNNNPEPCYQILEKIKNLPEKYKIQLERKVPAKLLIRTFNNEIELYRDLGEYEKGLALIPKVVQFLRKHQYSIPKDYLLLFWYQFAYLNFRLGDFSQAQRWLNEIARTNFEKRREDIQSFARLLGLIIQFELGHIMVLKYSVDSCRRFLKKKKKLEPFEQTLLRFFSKTTTSSKADYPDLFRELNAILFDPKKPQVNANHLDYLDFKAWLEGHL